MQRMLAHTRWVSLALVAALSVAVLAPAAEARGRRSYGGSYGYGSQYRYRDDGYRSPTTYRVPGGYHITRTVRGYSGSRYYGGGTYIVRRSSAGPVIAGFLGGIFLGAALANAAPHGYGYYDPYCHQSYASLNLYYSHLRRCDHPHVVRVVEVRDDGYGPGYSRGDRDCDDCDRDGSYDRGRDGSYDRGGYDDDDYGDDDYDR